MDPRVREHAAIIADHCVDLSAGDTVVIDAAPDADDLVTALFEIAGDVGAHPLVTRNRFGERFRRAYLRSHEGDFEEAAHLRALYEEMDVYIAIYSGKNTAETADVAPEVSSAYAVANRDVKDIRLDKRWLVTQYPSPAYAQLAGMSTEAYENFVWDAVNRDWEAQGAFQAQLVDLLDGADEVRLVSGEDTDLRLGIEGRTFVNDTANHNLPGGEIFTAPVVDEVEGTVRFDIPTMLQGREVVDVFLRFEDGVVVEHDAPEHRDLVTELLEADDGARRLGELGIGMNRGIDRFTYNMLFDEKMGDTVHLALGNAYEDTVPEGAERNASAVHEDLLVDMSEDASIDVDGEVVQRDGTFVFEDGFDA
ncbi:MAG: aminopeptidase [Actinobacteria bacterium]|nr:aminopeptidase [Actinomycetota bacterium]